MGEALEQSALERWRNDPAKFITEVLVNPETGKPFILLDAEKEFLKCAYALDAEGRLLYPEQCFAAPKKTGKTGFAAMHMLSTVLLFGGSFAEGFCVANDEEQAQGRVFQAVRSIVEKSPLLLREARVTSHRIEFPATGATIVAIASDYAGAAGANPTISCFDELWGYTSERSRRFGTKWCSPRRAKSLAGSRARTRASGRKHVARGTAQPGARAADHWPGPSCWRRSLDVLDAPSGCTMAGREVARADAPHAATEPISQND